MKTDKHDSHLRRPVRDRFLPNPKLKLREQVHEVIAFRHFSPRTKESYWHWIKGYLAFHRDASGGWRHLRAMGRRFGAKTARSFSATDATDFTDEWSADIPVRRSGAKKRKVSGFAERGADKNVRAPAKRRKKAQE